MSDEQKKEILLKRSVDIILSEICPILRHSILPEILYEFGKQISFIIKQPTASKQISNFFWDIAKKIKTFFDVYDTLCKPIIIETESKTEYIG